MGYCVNVSKQSTRTAPQRSRSDRKVRTRAQIIEATIRCVAEHGVEGATVSAIVADAGVSRGLLGYHFGGKPALLIASFQALADDYRRLLLMGQNGELREDVSLEESLPVILRRALGGPGDYDDRAWLGFWGVAHSDADLQRVNRELFDDVASYLGGILARIARHNGVVIDPGRAGRSLSVTIEGAWLHLTVGTLGFTLDEAMALCEQHARSLVTRAVE